MDRVHRPALARGHSDSSMIPSSVTTSGKFADLVLKVTPPRVPRHLLARQRLASSAEQLRGYPLLLVQAPAGFGKTALLAQWRLEHLGRGAVVAWFSADSQDDPVRLVQALALAVRQGAARPAFGRTLLDVPCPDALEGITAWLAEIAEAAMDTILFIDEADRLPGDAIDVLIYLMRNAPPNLRVATATRPELKLAIEDLLAYGQCRVVGPSMLRFQLEETLAVVAGQFGSGVDQDAAARLHEFVDGWPLGLQLALSAISSSADPKGAMAMLTRSGDLHQQLLGLLLANLDPSDVDFLTRVSVVDDLQPQLCRAMTGEMDAPDRLARLGRDTPIFTVGERGGWLRMHQIALDGLRQRFSSLPAEQQEQVHVAAARWLADHGLLEAAARHALYAGQRQWAYDLAEQSLYSDFLAHGRQGVVSEWLDRLPAQELDRRPRLLLAAAWTLAISGRHAEGAQLASRILAQPGVEDELRCECDLILTGAAAYGDDPDRFVEISSRWGDSPPLRDPLVLPAFEVTAAYRALLAGEPALARLRLEGMLKGPDAPSGYNARWGEFLIGLSYFREGHAPLAERQLRSTLRAGETDFGRRSQFACVVAAVLAAALWEMDRAPDAAAALANRLDVLEHSAAAEPVMLGYRTLARIALAGGAENRALELLEGMHAVGVARALPRLCISSLTEQIRTHARRFRAETCRELAERVDNLLVDFSPNRGPIWRREVEIQRHLAHAYAAIAAQDWRGALDPLSHGDILARQLKEGRLHIEFLGLRALVLDRCGENTQALLREAADLAQAYGLRRVFADAHPLLTDLMIQVAPELTGAGGSPPAPMRAPPERALPARAPSMALTPKEREVIGLLARNLSNKEIGLAMQVSDRAIKWHIKNLFAKLDAGTRKQLVQRARILGLLEEAV